MGRVPFSQIFEIVKRFLCRRSLYPPRLAYGFGVFIQAVWYHARIPGIGSPFPLPTPVSTSRTVPTCVSTYAIVTTSVHYDSRLMPSNDRWEHVFPPR